MNRLLNKISQFGLKQKNVLPQTFLNNFMPTSTFNQTSIQKNESSVNELSQSRFEYKEKNYNNNNNNKHWFAGMLLPILIFGDDQRRKNEQMNCFWNRSNKSNNGLIRNRIVKRIGVSEYNANDPIEDRYHCKQLKSIDAFACAVYDGHGGWELSEYAKKLLIDELDFQLEQLKKVNFKNEDEYITEALNKTFEYIENSFYQIALEGNINYLRNLTHFVKIFCCCLERKQQKFSVFNSLLLLFQ